MTELLLVAFIFLIAGVLAVPLAVRLGLGSVIGYFAAGLLIAPLLSALGVDVVSIQHFAEFGVVMMLFIVGLELEPRMLWSMRHRLLGLGGGQIVLTAAIITLALLAFDYSWRVALAVGLILSLSSTAIVLQSLNEKGLIKTAGGQGSFSVLLMQDIAVIPILALFPLLALPELADMAAAAVGGDDHSHDINLIAHLNSWQTALVTIGAVAGILLGGSRITHLVLRLIAAARLRELFTATALMLVVAIALLMMLVGLSPALGTFLAGVVLANSEYKHELEADIEPFKGLLLGLFFITVGASIDLGLFAANAPLVLGCAALLMALKFGVVYLLAGNFGIVGNDRWLAALALAQAGEFGFVLISFTLGHGILPSSVADHLLLVVALSMLLTPLLFIFYDKVIAVRFVSQQGRETDTIEEQGRIIIAGRGRIGGIVDRILRAAGYEATVIDYNSRHLDALHAFGLYHTYFGDATRPDLLHAAGIAEAEMIIISLDEKDQITKLVEHVVTTYPKVHVVARAVDRDHVFELWGLGCRDIIRETYDSSLRMGRSALEALGYDRDTSEDVVELFNQYDRQSMVDVASSYRPDMPSYENSEYVERVRAVMQDRGPALRDAIKEKLDAARAHQSGASNR